MEGGELPKPRSSPRVTLVGDILFLTGGLADSILADSVLAWDPVGETWQAAGYLAVPRYWHAAVAVPMSLVRC